MYLPSGGKAWNGRFQAFPLKLLPFREAGSEPSRRGGCPAIRFAGYGVQSKGRE